MTFRKGICAAAIVALASGANAEEASDAKVYAGLGLGGTWFKIDGVEDYEPNFVVLGGKLGARFNNYVDGEIRFQRGLMKDTTMYAGIDFETELEYIAGAYVKLGAGDKIHPYVMVGYSRVSMGITGTNGPLSASASGVESDTSFGLGVDYYLDGNAFLTAECASYYDSDDESLTSCMVSASALF